jgi:hypothetical protein
VVEGGGGGGIDMFNRGNGEEHMPFTLCKGGKMVERNDGGGDDMFNRHNNEESGGENIMGIKGNKKEEEERENYGWKRMMNEKKGNENSHSISPLKKRINKTKNVFQVNNNNNNNNNNGGDGEIFERSDAMSPFYTDYLIKSNSSQSLPTQNVNVGTGKLFSHSAAKLFEFPLWEELSIFDSDDLWDDKCFLLIPASYSLVRKNNDGDEINNPVDIITKIDIFVWMGRNFCFNDDNNNNENNGNNITYHFSYHNNNESLLCTWIQHVCNPLVTKIIKQLKERKREEKEKEGSGKNMFRSVCVNVFVEREGKESEEFWEYFENG